MRILAIETSCDETAIALVEITGPRESPDIKVLGNSLFSQAHLHEEYGGVYPNLAKREHLKNLPILLEKTLKQAEITAPPIFGSSTSKKVDCIAVTQGPGLEPALWTGINFAEELGKRWSASGRKIPVVPVNHMEGHIWSVLFRGPSISKQDTDSKLELPALALLVSGGHTELVLVKDFGSYEILGKTRDDAAGEAFDKVARMLNLGYTGGPKISKLAEKARGKRRVSGRGFPDAGREQTDTLLFPRPMIHSKDLNFSFSGLKTAVLYKIRQDNILETHSKEEVARAFEDAVVAVLIEKTRRALLENSDIKTIIVAGGVSANSYLKSKMEILAKNSGIQLRFPNDSLSTDNAVMIAIAAYIKIQSEQFIQTNKEIKAVGNLSF